MGRKNYFPHTWTPLSNRPSYKFIRPEGEDPSLYYRKFWKGIGYLRKYWAKNFTCPIEEKFHFKMQRNLIQQFSAIPALSHLSDLDRSCRGDASPQIPMIKLGLVGDIMWVRNNWENYCSEQLKNCLQDFDAIYGNLETIVSPHIPVRTYCPDRIRFNSPPEFFNSWQRTNGKSLFTGLSLANNHILDFNDTGVLDTLSALEKRNIGSSGICRNKQDKNWLASDINGIKIGFYAATYGVNHPGDLKKTRLKLNLISNLAPTSEKHQIDMEPIKQALTEMQQMQMDLKIISLHWGFEYEAFPTPKMMQAAREIIQFGADLIIGHHPHLQHPVEICFLNGYESLFPNEWEPIKMADFRKSICLNDETRKPRKALICYSLGNFATAMFTYLCRIGVILKLHLFQNPLTGLVDWCHPIVHLVYNDNPLWENRILRKYQPAPLKLIERDHTGCWYIGEKRANPHLSACINLVKQHLLIPYTG